MIHSVATLLRACVENNAVSTQQHGPGCNVSDGLKQSATPRRLSSLYIRKVTLESKGDTRVCVRSVWTCVFNRDTKRGKSLKEEAQASFYIEEFPARWVSAFLPLEIVRVEERGTLNVGCVCERRFSRQVPDLLLRCRVGLNLSKSSLFFPKASVWKPHSPSSMSQKRVLSTAKQLPMSIHPKRNWQRNKQKIQ